MDGLVEIVVLKVRVSEGPAEFLTIEEGVNYFWALTDNAALGTILAFEHLHF